MGGVYGQGRAEGFGVEPQKEPMLGLATTRELLREVATRMEISQNSSAGRRLGELCEQAVERLDRRVLDYRTVDQ